MRAGIRSNYFSLVLQRSHYKYMVKNWRTVRYPNFSENNCFLKQVKIILERRERDQTKVCFGHINDPHVNAWNVCDGLTYYYMSRRLLPKILSTRLHLDQHKTKITNTTNASILWRSIYLIVSHKEEGNGHTIRLNHNMEKN